MSMQVDVLRCIYSMSNIAVDMCKQMNILILYSMSNIAVGMSIQIDILCSTHE